MAIDGVRGVARWVLACLCLMGVLSARAEQFGSSLLGAWSSCADDSPIEMPITTPIESPLRPISDFPANLALSSLLAPTITATKAVKDYAYVSTAYRVGGAWHGSLLKYRTIQGVMVGADGVPIYQNHQPTLRQDVWATGQTWQNFGTQGQSQHQNGGLWLLGDKFANDVIHVTAAGANTAKLVNYHPDELAKITHMASHDTIGAVMYPPSIDSVSDTLIYTDSQGVLRLVDTRHGRQLMAFLVVQGLGEFGIDAAWRLYRLTDDNGQERLVAVGGFGRSDVGLMALDVSDVAKGGKPVVLYQLSSRNADFQHLSHIHAPISLAYIKQGNKKVAAFVFGAGADACYQNNTTCQKSTADGAAVYAINALTGQKVSEWSGAALSNVSHIKHSFAGEVTLIDRQGDGAIEQVYAADLGGQIFRFDVHGGEAVRVFAANDDGGGLFDDGRIRFYQKPIVSLYDSHDYPLYPRRSKRFALISIASNDQIPTLRDKVNFVYGVFDDGLMDLQIHPTITPASLVMIDDKMHHTTHYLAAMARAKGWQRAIAINGDTDVTLTGAGSVTPSSRAWRRRGVRGLYHLSVAKHASCPSQIISQAQAYCLPFGVCANQQTGTAFVGRDDGVLTSAVIDGSWVGSVAKLDDRTLMWQTLRPDVGDMQPSDDISDVTDDIHGDDGDSIYATMTKTLRFLRWYDVRSTKE